MTWNWLNAFTNTWLTTWILAVCLLFRRDISHGYLGTRFAVYMAWAFLLWRLCWLGVNFLFLIHMAKVGIYGFNLVFVIKIGTV